MQEVLHSFDATKKAEFWQGHIEAWMTTGLSQAEYSRNNQISKSRFSY